MFSRSQGIRLVALVETLRQGTLPDYPYLLCIFMKKSDKKIDNALRNALSNVCETALGKVDGFVWLTHLVNYNAFPDSLKVVCVFDTDEALSKAIEAKQDDYLYQLIQHELSSIGIKLNRLRQQVSFDTEEACDRSHVGKWNERLSQLQSKVTLH